SSTRRAAGVCSSTCCSAAGPSAPWAAPWAPRSTDPSPSWSRSTTTAPTPRRAPARTPTPTRRTRRREGDVMSCHSHCCCERTREIRIDPVTEAALRLYHAHLTAERDAAREQRAAMVRSQPDVAWPEPPTVPSLDELLCGAARIGIRFLANA